MKHKSPAQLNSRVIRINVGTYQLLKELSRIRGITMAEAVDQAITDIAKRERIVTPRTQIPMPLLEAFTVRPGIQRPMSLRTAIATNGSKGVAFRIRPKGVSYAGRARDH